MNDGTVNSIGADGQALDWNLIPWDFIEKSIRKLRQRIFRAIREQKWNKARSLMKLMLPSYFNLLVSVRQVTQKNKSKKTVGVDGEVAPQGKSEVRVPGIFTIHGADHELTVPSEAQMARGMGRQPSTSRSLTQPGG